MRALKAKHIIAISFHNLSHANNKKCSFFFVYLKIALIRQTYAAQTLSGGRVSGQSLQVKLSHDCLFSNSNKLTILFHRE